MMPSKHEHHIKAGHLDRCRVCGQPKADRVIWFVDLDLFEHEECRDWSKASFPMDGKLFVIREVAVTARLVFEAAVALGTEMKAARDKWPENARQRLESIRERSAQVTEAIAKVVRYKDWFR